HLSDGISNELSVVFSLGIILWEIVTSEIPFGEVDSFNASNRIMNGQRPYLSGINNTPVGNLIEKCWAQYPTQRISLDDLYKEIQELIKTNNTKQQSKEQSDDQKIDSSLNLIQQLSKHMSPRQYNKYFNVSEAEKSDLLEQKRKQKANQAFKKLNAMLKFKSMGSVGNESNKNEKPDVFDQDEQQDQEQEKEDHEQEEQEQEEEDDDVNKKDDDQISNSMGSLKRRSDEDEDKDDDDDDF
ncbi:MAG: hypothetical protein EZS28_032875, partial [Streblomastix strix]